ncbi:hypothetical protein [Maridesulfovibrio sp.]|uniref:hypothetical protein n=1 Tax=Maridesulfovibrio sp. TaxID=2795000 RepID=UPI0029F5299C|nr:hypothetical protein [Maridesulfovibrio sp.]
MIFSILFVSAGILATIVACKGLNGTFELKSDDISNKEKQLNDELQDLRDKRKDLARRLDNLKTLLKAGVKSNTSDTSKESPTELKGWLLQRGILTEAQFLSAEIYAIEKNINIIGALLTLNMISIEIYEEAKKMKLL